MLISGRMMAAIKAMVDGGIETPVDIHFIFTIAEEIGQGASAVLLDNVVAMVSIDNGTTERTPYPVTIDSVRSAR